MKSKKFSDSLGNIDDSYIEEAITYKPNKTVKPWVRWISLAACICLIASASFAAFKKGLFTTTVQAANLMDGITPNSITALDDLSVGNENTVDFAIRLFKQTNADGENTLISPLSILYAIAMTANGAEGETLSQIEQAIGMSVEDLNIYLYSYMNSPKNDSLYKVSIANSIWINDTSRFNANQDFLQINADYYNADIYKSPFNRGTVKSINNWVNDKTNSMIPQVVEEIPDEALMYLINALAFEAEWADKYQKHQVRNNTFTKDDGTEQNVKFMYSDEGIYIEDDNATGFIKYYSGYKYAFVALLPNDDISVSEYLSTIDGNSICRMLENKKHITVETAMPKFEVEYNNEMSTILKSMGIQNAFDEYIADFDGMGKSELGNMYIDQVIHKTYIQVAETGTKAGAVTSVAMNGAGMPFDEIKKVYLDRPFVYMIIDCDNNVPLFIGTLMDVKK